MGEVFVLRSSFHNGLFPHKQFRRLTPKELDTVINGSTIDLLKSGFTRDYFKSIDELKWFFRNHGYIPITYIGM